MVTIICSFVFGTMCYFWGYYDSKQAHWAQGYHIGYKKRELDDHNKLIKRKNGLSVTSAQMN